jgi:hypothetical protein
MPKPLDEHDQKFLDIITEHDWHVMYVGGDEESPSFTYSTGIFALTGRPEIIVFGLPMEVAHSVVNEYGNRARAGETLASGDFYDDFLEGHPVTFIPVEDEDLIKRYATWTDWFYDRRQFPLLQLVDPDSKSGAFPWQPDYREEWHWHQPLLGRPPARS